VAAEGSGRVSGQTVFVVWSNREDVEGVFTSLDDAVQHSNGLDPIGEYVVGQKGLVMMYSAQGVPCGKRRKKRSFLRLKAESK
jgi:hypothetical protein